MNDTIEPFEFKQCISISKSTGEKAVSLKELEDRLSSVSDDSIFHHTYQYFLKGHILEYTNDFAHWAGESLEERALAEHLSNIDPYDFKDIRDLRNELIRVIHVYRANFPEPREVLPGNEFYFTETITIIYPVGIRAKNLAEFLTAMKYIDIGSIYYHFFEARTRLGGETDDFSKWILDGFGKKGLAEKISAIDPFMHNLEGIKIYLVETIEEEVKRDMEVIDICSTGI
jgi:hypothetical protein